MITTSSTTREPSTGPPTSAASFLLTSKVRSAGETRRRSAFPSSLHFFWCFHKLGYLLYRLPHREQQYARTPVWWGMKFTQFWRLWHLCGQLDVASLRWDDWTFYHNVDKDTWIFLIIYNTFFMMYLNAVPSCSLMWAFMLLLDTNPFPHFSHLCGFWPACWVWMEEFMMCAAAVLGWFWALWGSDVWSVQAVSFFPSPTIRESLRL